MADCETAIQRLTFDFSDPQITKVTVEINFLGDCPHFMKRRYEKTFPARYSAVDIMTREDGVPNYLLW